MPHFSFASALPAFLASFVEFVEASTVVLAVGVTRGARSAAVGTFAGIVALAVLIAIGAPLTALVPLDALRLATGILVLFFGMRWLRKAILRYAGVIALHDETAIYAREMQTLQTTPAVRGTLDRAGIATAFGAVVLEGLEVAFIVVAIGAPNGSVLAATIGAAAAGLVVIAIAAILRAPLARVPENALKYAVGTMLSAFGTFWTAEGFGAAWPGNDLALLWLTLAFGLGGALGIVLARRAHGGRVVV